mmetsp:Transcript_26659/g.39939  ORF Transcript_26659/g.39939 Transcript_26659/m.39939 type:complete len:116 (-) Transcript_26659:484-831(-)
MIVVYCCCNFHKNKKCASKVPHHIQAVKGCCRAGRLSYYIMIKSHPDYYHYNGKATRGRRRRTVAAHAKPAEEVEEEEGDCGGCAPSAAAVATSPSPPRPSAPRSLLVGTVPTGI